jgi:hypothetical protein
MKVADQLWLSARAWLLRSDHKSTSRFEWPAGVFASLS